MRYWTTGEVEKMGVYNISDMVAVQGSHYTPTILSLIESNNFCRSNAVKGGILHTCTSKQRFTFYYNLGIRLLSYINRIKIVLN
jgi:hypothetical protein